MSGVRGDEAAGAGVTGVDWRAEWEQMGRVIRDRTTRPFSKPLAVLYFVLCIMILGGSGLWVSIGFVVWDGGTALDALLLSLLLSMVTYGAALLGTALLDTLLDVDTENDRVTRLSLFFVNAFTVLLAAGLITGWRFGADEEAIGWVVLAWIGFAAALFIVWLNWWITSASDRRFSLDPSASAGGDPQKQIKNAA